MIVSIAKKAPIDVAVFLPKLPPIAIGLPVITAGINCLRIILYSSIIHPIIIGLVYISGAGISTSGPIKSAIASIYPRLKRSNSIRDNSLGLTVIPPFAPPKGKFTTAHLKVIQNAKDFTSSIETFG